MATALLWNSFVTPVELNAKQVTIEENAKVTPKTSKVTKKILKVPKKQKDFKAWMSYSVFSKSSAQAKLQKKAKTGKYGIREVTGRKCVAVGTYYSKKVGDKLDITLKNGKKIKCIVADVKADKDTNKTNQVCKHNGSIVEFVVNTKKMPKSVRHSGSYSSIKSLSGKITKIEKIK